MMNNLFLISSILVLSYQKKTHQNQNSPLKVTIYEESLCIDSHNLFVYSLARAVRKVGFFDMVELNIVPYGNANYTIEKNGPVFSCQHGQQECYGNKVHLCSMDLADSPLQRVLSVLCHFQNGFQTKNFTSSAIICGNLLDIKAEQIIQCANSDKGDQLLLKAGRNTSGLVPRQTFIPWVTTEGNHIQNSEKSIFLDMYNWACRNYKGSLPQPCFQ